jgi:hypothetical protein
VTDCGLVVPVAAGAQTHQRSVVAVLGALVIAEVAARLGAVFESSE